jgi:pyruvate/2-oxoglutarate dehydrogenase complex dihydrolipoamide dehydrogenase (E3) component
VPAEDVHVVVIGMGPGGEDAAMRLAQSGLVVVGVDRRLLGGECPYFACVPTKMMVRASDAIAEGRRIAALAGAAEVRPDWAPVAARIREEATDNWDDTVAVRRFEQAGGRFVRGTGRITGPGIVTVSTADGARVFRATRAIVLNPGTEPTVPPIDGLADTPFWTNREASAATEVPDSLIVLGGGPVGCELAQVFARFGCETTVIEAGPRLLGREEPESSDVLTGAFRADHIDVHTGVPVTRVSHDDGMFAAHLDNGRVVRAQRLLVATGRHTDIAALGVRAVGIDDTARKITVDGHLRAADGVWAIGDVTGHGAFTHVSMYQARIAVSDILGRDGPPADYRAVSRVTFTDPEIGSVGMTEAQAREQGRNIRTATTQIPSSTRGWIHKIGNNGLIKLVEDADQNVLVGATSVGPVGGEVLGALAVAVHGRVPTEVLRTMIYAYPTFHRAIEDAVNRLGTR